MTDVLKECYWEIAKKLLDGGCSTKEFAEALIAAYEAGEMEEYHRDHYDSPCE